MTKNIFILAAENSAEKYGALLIKRFLGSGNKYSFFGAGGDRFKELGVDLLAHSKELSIVGIVEVVSHILKLNRYMRLFIKESVKRKCDAAILIDYPDFNLRLAKRLKKRGIPVYYYISPTVWAWRYSRVELIRKYVTHLFVIFPFEKDIFIKEKIGFTYTGHPLVNLIRMDITGEEFRSKQGVKEKERILTLLPGSRYSEISSLLPVMLKAVSVLKKKYDLQIFLLMADSIDIKITEKFIGDSGMDVKIINQKRGYDLIGSSDVIISTCGTSNLEIAILGTPFVAVYRVNRLSYLLGKGFLKISDYSIVNILLKKRVVEELIQRDFSVENVVRSVESIILDTKRIRKMKTEFSKLKGMLTLEKDPSEIIFEKIEKDLES